MQYQRSIAAPHAGSGVHPDADDQQGARPRRRACDVGQEALSAGLEDTDTAAATVTSLGGRVIMAASDSPFGRMAVVTGTQGEVFGIIAVVPAT